MVEEGSRRDGSPSGARAGRLSTAVATGLAGRRMPSRARGADGRVGAKSTRRAVAFACGVDPVLHVASSLTCACHREPESDFGGLDRGPSIDLAVRAATSRRIWFQSVTLSSLWAGRGSFSILCLPHCWHCGTRTTTVSCPAASLDAVPRSPPLKPTVPSQELRTRCVRQFSMVPRISRAGIRRARRHMVGPRGSCRRRSAIPVAASPMPRSSSPLGSGTVVGGVVAL